MAPRKRLENRTADGRDLSKEEWRTIPGFTNYQITSDGDIRNRYTFYVLSEMMSRSGSFYYTIKGDDGKVKSRDYTGFLYLAYPELKPPPRRKDKVEPKRRYKPKGLWFDIPESPQHQINKEGVVRNRSSQGIIKVHYDASEPYVKIGEVSQKRRYSISYLLGVVFPESTAGELEDAA